VQAGLGPPPQHRCRPLPCRRNLRCCHAGLLSSDAGILDAAARAA
jgi:hypothetical protein